MASNKYPAFSPNAVVVLERRYLMKDEEKRPIEAPPDMLRRVAKDIALAEFNYGATAEEVQKIEDEFYEVIRLLYFMPNSPTLMNAGRELQQLSACFVLPVEDNLDAIYTRVRDTAMIHQSGGGTGFSFSRLRPEGDTVSSTSGVASGPVSFMRVYDVATDVVKQGGTRRGANMAILDCTHPDIEKFVDMKLDPTAMTNFNVSVSVSDEFMKAAAEDQEWPLYNPRTGLEQGTVNAGALMKKIADNAWRTGDPGLVFLDRINETHPNQHLGKITATNPCVTADCWVMTKEGPRQAGELVGNQFMIMDENGVRQTDQRGFYPTGHQETFWLNTKHGYRVRLTADHRVKTIKKTGKGFTNYHYVAAHKLKAGDLIPLQRHTEEWPAPTGGDRKAKRDADAVTQGHLMSATTISEMHRCSSQYHLEFTTQIIHRAGVIKKDTEGKTTDMLVIMQPQAPIHDVQLILLRLGVVSEIVENGLSINSSSMNKLMERIPDSVSGPNFERTRGNLDSPNSNASTQQCSNEYVTQFTSLESAGKADVYDVTVDQNDQGLPVFDGQGFHLHNCGEQPLLDYESCNLGSINVAQLRKDAKNDQEFYELLEMTCQRATRFLDNVIDRNNYPLEMISQRTRATRRIGVGVMGFSDLLIMEDIRYDSEAGIKRAKELMSFIQSSVHVASQELANQRGPYPEWQNRTNVSEAEIPMRNTSPTTIAPTGTISIIAGASSGIEPLFALVYERHVMDDDRLAEFHPLFLDMAQKHGITPDDPRMAQVIETGSLHGLGFPAELEQVFRVSHDISPIWHVRMQAAWQEFCDNAVSKTVNMPQQATEDDVMSVYLMAWETGCKGVTVYRDGSKADQVLSTAESRQRSDDDNKEKRRDHESGYRRRPDTLQGVTHRINTGHGTTYITVNNDDQGRPFEVFVAGGKSGGCDEAQSQAITRLATLALRNNVETEEITKQLTGIVCCPHWENGKVIGSLADAIAEALRRHRKTEASEPTSTTTNLIAMSEPDLPDGIISNRTQAMIQLAERRQAGMECPEPDCKGTVVENEGCRTCHTCGWSNCG